MKKYSVIYRLIILTLICFVIAGCGDKDHPPIMIEGEEDARAVYGCPNNNMFGLEKVVLFDKSAVIVFDKTLCDKGRKYGGLLEAGENNTIKTYCSMHNVSAYTNFGTIEERDGRYVVTAGVKYSDADLYDPEEDAFIEGVTVGQKSVYIKDGSFYLIYLENTSDDEMTFYTQEYDPASDTWGDIEISTAPVLDPVPD